ncbi:MAG TPA: ATP-binding protein [Nocardioidaceae bacterium]|nr:ATP-binding protein [Nocardioidaceae bacterium]
MSTERPAKRGGGSALAISAWPLRRKVALALAIPLVLAGTLGGLRVQSDLVEASNSSSSARQVTALRPAVDYLTAAEQAMIAAVGTDEDSKAALEESLADIRSAGRELLESKESADLTDDQRYQVDAVLDLSQVLRADDAITLSPGTWVAQLRQLQSGVTQLITTIVDEQINPEPRLELLSQTLAGRFSLAMQQALVATERTGETGSLELFSELGAEGAAVDRIASALGASEKAVASLRTANAQRFRTVRTGGTDLGGANAYADYDTIISTLQDGIDDELEAAAAEARTGAFVNAAVTLAALVAAILLALLISRLLLNPIRRVREGALAVAHERLPEAVARIRAGEEPGEITPIDVTTEEEIGQLARAVDDMHRQAVVLASGEASLRSQVSQMFVTLSRRNTSLINQQLGLIERLERDEEDPKRLESLFRLDHLAARMRRTADSLLILADAPTANAVVDGLTVSDALQAATSGVQDYQRVRIRSANPMRIDDSAAADVVHLLTELVDNALTYSPPTSTVTVGSTTTAQGVVIEVADAGLGIPAEQLTKINNTLGSGGDVTPDTARRMGLFVVSRLSQRHGLTTSLRANDEGGTTATVVLPVAILPDLAPRPAPRTREAAPKPREAAPKPEAPTAGATRVPQKTERKPKRSDRKPETVEAKGEKPGEMDIKARIDAALGLPTRRPGAAAGAPAMVTPSTASAALAALRPLRHGPHPAPAVEPAGPPSEPVVQAGAEPVAELVAEAPVKPSPGRSEPTPKPSTEPTSRQTDLPTRGEGAAAEPATSGPETAEDTRPTAATAPAAPAAAPVAAPATAPAAPAAAPVAAPAAAQAPEPTPALTTRGPLAANDALDGDWTDPGDEGFDTPIFRSLRSAWLSSGDDAQPWRTSEIEVGWEMADQVAETTPEPEVSESGLPIRRPGSRLVPGGVTTTPTATVRDPEAIRARLAAHASGVSRGRAAATAVPDPSLTEAGS